MSHSLRASEPSRDPLGRTRVYQLARALVPDCWNDAKTLRAEPLTEAISGQLYSAVCSIAANIAEAYSRSSGRDRARIFEYALGSVRESMEWYRSVTPVIGETTVNDRLDVLEEMRRMLLAIIPRERGRPMK
ncbi:MAG TPA: four helix bundle protein [Gemmatimonadaceae bacterium]|nr:four helix bundle protein [Gemmatimonadaceae bacterium]